MKYEARRIASEKILTSWFCSSSVAPSPSVSRTSTLIGSPSGVTPSTGLPQIHTPYWKPKVALAQTHYISSSGEKEKWSKVPAQIEPRVKQWTACRSKWSVPIIIDSIDNELADYCRAQTHATSDHHDICKSQTSNVPWKMALIFPPCQIIARSVQEITLLQLKLLIDAWRRKFDETSTYLGTSINRVAHIESTRPV